MSRNIDLIRWLLLRSDGDESALIECEKFPVEVRAAHVEFLVETGLVEGIVRKDPNGIPNGAVVSRITWNGHELLDLIRDDHVWREAKEEVMKPGVPWSFDILKQWAGNYHNQKVAALTGYRELSDPLKRRYQVFVSSTYEDLKEERWHAMQALLETKCIPTGMELFPAASEDQWKLIQRVIDDCDYYVVIVAGRYGSLGPSGKSYTEMEFDYAVDSGKSILGFFHSEVDGLPASRVEKCEALKTFTAKIKSKPCKGWTTPHALGSAIKSAMLNAFENDPKPGWMRASSSQPELSSPKHSLVENASEVIQVTPAESTLSDNEIKILKWCARNRSRRHTAEQIAQEIQVHILVAEQLLEKLTKAELLYEGHKLGLPSSFGLTSKGRDYVISHNLL